MPKWRSRRGIATFALWRMALEVEIRGLYRAKVAIETRNGESHTWEPPIEVAIGDRALSEVPSERLGAKIDVVRNP
jgi:hypothetical protein